MNDKGHPGVLEIFETIWDEEVAQNGFDATKDKLKEWVYDWFLTAWLLRKMKTK